MIIIHFCDITSCKTPFPETRLIIIGLIEEIRICSVVKRFSVGTQHVLFYSGGYSFPQMDGC